MRTTEKRNVNQRRMYMTHSHRQNGRRSQDGGSVAARIKEYVYLALEASERNIKALRMLSI
jgi:hypothetical protein